MLMKKDTKDKQAEKEPIKPLGDEKINEAQGKGPLLLTTAAVNLIKNRDDTLKIITKIQNDTNNAEKDRRNKEQKNRDQRTNKIETEVITSHKKNVEIDWNWQELEEKEDCQELANVS